MYSVEPAGNDGWILVHWREIGLLLRQGFIVSRLTSKAKVDAECEATLQGYKLG